MPIGMLVYSVPILAFVATQPHANSLVHGARVQSHAVRPSMGFLDGFKSAFENDKRLQSERDANAAGKTKNVPAYVKQKEKERQAYEKEMQQKTGKAQSSETGSRMDEFLSKWKW